MKIISFAWTTPALLAGVKTVTRRQWAPRHAEAYRAGDLIAAYDRSPRYRGHQVAVIRLTKDVYPEPSDLVPESDWEAEGFAWMQERALYVDGVSPQILWRSWKLHPKDFFVVRFELVEVLSAPVAAHCERPRPRRDPKKPWPGYCQACGAALDPPNLTWCPTCGSTDEDET